MSVLASWLLIICLGCCSFLAAAWIARAERRHLEAEIRRLTYQPPKR